MPNYVSKELNRVCTAAGVQCTVTMGTRQWKKLYQFKNLSSHDVEISQYKVGFIVRPGEEFELRGDEPTITQWFVSYRSPL